MGLVEVMTKSFSAVLKEPKVVLPYVLYIVVAFIAVFALLFSVLIPQIKALGQTINSTIQSSVQSSFNSTYLNATTPVSSSAFSSAMLRSLVAAAHSLLAVLLPLLVGFTIYIILMFLFNVFIQGVFVDSAAQIVQKGKLNLTLAFSNARKKYLSLLGANVLLQILNIVILTLSFLPVLLYLPSLFSTTAISAGSSVLGALFGILPLLILSLVIYAVLMIFYSIFFFQVNPAIMIEKRRAVDGIRRSIEITSKRMGKVFLMLLLMLLFSVPVVVLYVVLSIIPIAGTILAVLLQIFYATWFGMVPTFFYFEFIAGKKQKVQRPSSRAPSKK